MELTPTNITRIVIVAVLGLILAFAIPSVVENLDAKHVMVIQYPNGTLKAVTEPGVYAQWFGNVTKYDRRAQFAFGGDAKADAPPLPMRFNDGGHATIKGAVSWEMPTTPDQLIRLQKDFGSQDAIEQQLVARALNNAVYFTGPLMSSTESSGERRSEMLQDIDDQARLGVYSTVTRQERRKDPVTGVEQMVAVVEVAKGPNGTVLRNSGSAIGDYGLTLLPLSIGDITYDKVVEDQIKQRQAAITQVQIAVANARRAEQEKLTTEAQGAANAAKAKWEQETIKAKAVTEAQQGLEVATLNKAQAEQEKQRLILEGQGESEKRRLIMSADGALDKKLDAYVQVSKLYAEAMANYKGAWVPNVVMGNGGTTSSNGAQALVDMLTAKTARELGLDLKIQPQTAK